LKNLNTDCLDLIQLHCPPTDAYYHPELFDVMDGFVKAGKIRYYGVSVERVEEALKAIEYPNVQTVQIIFNCFRQRGGAFLCAGEGAAGWHSCPGAAGERDADGEDDQADYVRGGRPPELQPAWRGFRHGRDFLRRRLRRGAGGGRGAAKLVPPGASMSQFALRWILMFDAVTCAIPGGKKPEQVADNARASDLPPLSAETMAAVKRFMTSGSKLGCIPGGKNGVGW